MEKNCPSHSGTHCQNGICPPKFPISRDSSQTKAAIMHRPSWPWLPEGWLSPAFRHWAQCFPSYGKEPSLLHRHPRSKLVKFPQKFLSTRVSPGQKLPGQTALAGLGLLRASSHLPSKHCGSMLFFLWNWPSPPGQNG